MPALVLALAGPPQLASAVDHAAGRSRGAFAVTVTVLAVDDGGRILDAVTLPASTRLLASGRAQRSFLVERSGEQTAAHFRAILPAEGWTLVAEVVLDQRSSIQTWASEVGRVRIDIEAPIGDFSASRVLVRVAP